MDKPLLCTLDVKQFSMCIRESEYVSRYEKETEKESSICYFLLTTEHLNMLTIPTCKVGVLRSVEVFNDDDSWGGY